MSEYEKPDWCSASTWQNAKELVFTLVPESLMARTGQRRIEIAATALMEEAKEAWEQVDVMSNWGVAEVSMLNKSVYDYVVHWEGRTEKAEAQVEALERAILKSREEAFDECAAYIEGKGGVIPGAAVFAPLVSRNNMPDMSGDPRARLRPQDRWRFDEATASLASAIRQHSQKGEK